MLFKTDTKKKCNLWQKIRLCLCSFGAHLLFSFSHVWNAFYFLTNVFKTASKSSTKSSTKSKSLSFSFHPFRIFKTKTKYESLKLKLNTNWITFCYFFCFQTTIRFTFAFIIFKFKWLRVVSELLQLTLFQDKSHFQK